jgi:hypothetical protein
LAHQSDALIILAIVQFSVGTFQTSTSNSLHISSFQSDKPHMIFKLAFSCRNFQMYFSVYNVTWMNQFAVCDRTRNFDQNDFHLYCLSSSETGSPGL